MAPPVLQTAGEAAGRWTSSVISFVDAQEADPGNMRILKRSFTFGATIDKSKAAFQYWQVGRPRPVTCHRVAQRGTGGEGRGGEGSGSTEPQVCCLTSTERPARCSYGADDDKYMPQCQPAIYALLRAIFVRYVQRLGPPAVGRVCLGVSCIPIRPSLRNRRP